MTTTSDSSAVLFAASLALLAFAAQGHERASVSTVRDLVERRVRALEGARTYRAHCAACHGERGDGRGPHGRALGAPPRDFTSGIYKLRTTPYGSPPTTDDLVRTIRVGLPGTAMPGWQGVLDDEEMRALAAYLETLSPRLEAEGAPLPLALPREPPAAEGALARGRAVYLVMGCRNCHGLEGRGDGPQARALVDYRSRPIRPANFTSGVLKSGPAAADVLRTIFTGLNGTPMIAWGAGLVVGRDALIGGASSIEGISADEVKLVDEFLATLPTQAELSAWSEERRRAHAERLGWDLARYIRSLGERSLWRRAVDWLFRDPWPAVSG